MRFRLAAVALAAGSFAAHADTLEEAARRASCLIGPNNIYKLSIPVQGTLARVAVKRADTVKKGQVVAELESAVERSQVEAARIRAATDATVKLKQAVWSAANAKFDRQRKLRAMGGSTEQLFEEAQAAALVARGEVEQAELDRSLSALDYTRLQATLDRRILRAPADGVITAVDLHEGEYSDPANAVATLTEIDPLKVDVYLPASVFPQVSVGMTARVEPQEPIGGSRAATVIVKDPQIDAASGLFLVQLRLPNPDGGVPAGIRCGVTFGKR